MKKARIVKESKYYCKNYILPYLKKRNIQISGKMKKKLKVQMQDNGRNDSNLF